MGQRQIDIEAIRLIASHLGSLMDEVVFVGGGAASFLITDKASPSIRPTFDIDIIVQLSSRKQYYELEENLRNIGFVQRPQEDGLLCRWEIDGIKVDVMPTLAEITGIANPWFEEAFESATWVKLDEKISIRVISAPLFIATKLEAFFIRGESSFRTSKDLEDIIAVVDGTDGLLEKIDKCSDALKEYLSHSIASLLQDEEFQDALPGHLPPDSASQARLPGLIKKLEILAKMK